MMMTISMKLGKYTRCMNLESIAQCIRHKIDHLPNHSIGGYLSYMLFGILLETDIEQERRHNQTYHGRSFDEPYVFQLKGI